MTKKIFWIVFGLAIALYGITAKPLVLGLDLKGGVTMRYELEASDTTDAADPSSMIDSTVDTLRNRINTYGIRESAITRQGEREIVIELPGSSMEEADTIQSLVSRVGRLEFRLAMRADGTDDDPRNKVVISEQVARLREYLEADDHARTTPSDLNLQGLDVDVPQGPLYRWYAFSNDMLAERRGQRLDGDVTIESVLSEAPLTVDDFSFVKIEREPGRTFTGGDIASTMQVPDEKGGAAVGVTMRPDRASAFGDWTEPNVNKLMGILLDGRMAQSPAVIQSRLDGEFRISSPKATGFTPEEIREYLTVIKSGSLQMKPRLLYRNTIGPSLGESSIQAGLTASAVGFAAIILFMLLYYRVNGVIASACLILNMTMLTGLLMFLGATLTLPGIAGLVLTLGMAVDANILVFERMREESDRAKSVAQAVKLGYEKAFSTIIDANITTFVTAFILYKVGSGPVRGFSVILMLGIATSVFSVLVFGRVIYDLLVDRGFENVAMGRLVKQDTNISFLSKKKIAMTGSSIAVLLGMALFVGVGADKYGLDFLGGYKAQVRLSAPARQGEVKAALDGSIFESAQVISVEDGVSTSEEGSLQYVIKLKSLEEVSETDAPADLLKTYEEPLKQALAGRILPDFVGGVSLDEDAATASTRIGATLHFADGALDTGAISTHLGFLSDLSVESPSAGVVTLAGTWPAVDLEAPMVVQRLRSSLVDVAGVPAPSVPFLESTMIGSRVGTELRDSAIRAILLSFIAIVLYIRVRFREYRYGFAAIIALAHDVIITLGLVSIVHVSGLVDVEIDLAMIAAFLTIIGYSLNDTIVLFDRVRENLPRMSGKSFEEVLDISINQTLGRTLLTSTTTLVALVIIFFFNYGRQNVLEGFSFAMIIGVVVGTYSSIFVASPVLTMMADPHHHAHGGSGGALARKQGKGPRSEATGVPV